MGSSNANPLLLETCFIKLKLDHSKFESAVVGDYIHEEVVSAGGLKWSIACFPRGHTDIVLNDSEYVYLVVSTRDKPTKVVRATFHAFVLGRDGEPSFSFPTRSIQVAITCKPDDTRTLIGVAERFMKRSGLESGYLIDGCITLICGITILPDDDTNIAVPASELGNHLGNLLECTDGSDVSFVVGGETFRAHRAVLAAHSPVFKAQLFGSMADAKMACITLHDIKPATFQILLKFIYTDELPADKDMDTSSSSTSAITVELLQHVLAAADMYQLDRLKLMCAKKLCDRITVDNVAMMVGCAEMYSCPELKKRCMDFFMVERNFKKVVVTEGYLRLMQGFPSVIDEIRERVQT